jgi:hypothetical protein
LEENNMNALAILAIIEQVIKNLPESTQRELDAAVDKVEDKFKQGSIQDVATELVCKLLRGQIGLKDFPDDIKKEK